LKFVKGHLRSVKHGHAFPGKMTKIYKIWRSMKRRCYDKNNDNYSYYGGKGVVVCERWQKFKNFFLDMGNPPTEKHTIDRINNDRGYEPENCKWSTKQEQMQNRSHYLRIAVNGELLTTGQWERKLGLPRAAISERITNGMPPYDAVTKPFRKRRKRCKLTGKLL